jgi:hypothetical protein
MKEQAREVVEETVKRVCEMVEQKVPQAVEFAGAEFSGVVTIKISMNCGGIRSAPRIALEF